MSARVRCAGGGQWYETWEDAEIGADRNVPCGWEGPADDADTGRTHLEGGTTVHEYHCPNCGGSVELIKAVAR